MHIHTHTHTHTMYCIIFLVGAIKTANSVSDFKYHNSLSSKFLVFLSSLSWWKLTVKLKR